MGIAVVRRALVKMLSLGERNGLTKICMSTMERGAGLRSSIRRSVEISLDFWGEESD